MAADIELNPETTKEEMQAFVDEIAAEDSGKETPKGKEAKSDAEIVSGLPEETPLPDEGDETAEAPKKGKREKAAKAADSAKADADDRSWLDDDLRQEISGYGIDEEELAEFTSREEVERALRILGKRALEAGRKAQADASKEPTRDAQGRFTKGETSTDAETPAPVAETTKPSYEIKLSKDKYEDDIVDELTGLRDHYESRIAELEAKFSEAEAQAEEERFDSAVDELELPKLFGTTGSESKEELERRRELMVLCKAQQIGLAQLTGRSPSLESLVLRVAQGVHPEEFSKRVIKSHTVKLTKQSNRRQGGGATRPTDPPENDRDWADRLYKQMAGA